MTADGETVDDEDGASPMRIGLLFEYATLNGGEQSILAVLTPLLEKSSLTPVIFAPATGPLAQACLQRKLVHQPFDLNVESRDPAALTARLNALIHEHRLQLLHANSLSAGRKLGTVATELDCPTSAHLRDILKLSGPAVAALNRHRGLIAVSQATRDFHVQQGVNAESVHVLYNGIDTALFRPRPPTGWLHRELGLMGEETAKPVPLAAIVGQICLRKGHDDMARAAVLLKDRLPDLHFVLVGERHSTKAESVEFDEQITRTFAQAGLLHRLHRLGRRENMSELYPEFRLLVHAARQEPLGRVLLEAAACGLPIVTTTVGGTEEILAHRESAWLVPPSDPVALAEGIGQLLGNPQLCDRFTAFARRTIEQRFSIEQAARQQGNWWRHWGGEAQPRSAHNLNLPLPRE